MSFKTLKKPQNSNINAFIDKAKQTPKRVKRGRLIFAMDATASRESSWSHACEIQSAMFNQTMELGGLDVQLCYFRGFNEFEYSNWCNNADQLNSIMRQVACVAGHTQIVRLLRHTYVQSQQEPINALVFIGDSVEENVDTLCQRAGELSLYGVPVFIFQEGHDEQAQAAFQEIATLTHGAYARFDASSATQLRDLLSAVAVYAAGGRAALQQFQQSLGHTVLALPSAPPVSNNKS